MPIYDYECAACGERFDRLIRTPRDERALACPACGGSDVARRPSVFAAHAAPTKRDTPRGACARCGDPDGPCVS